MMSSELDQVLTAWNDPIFLFQIDSSNFMWKLAGDSSVTKHIAKGLNVLVRYTARTIRVTASITLCYRRRVEVPISRRESIRVIYIRPACVTGLFIKISWPRLTEIHRNYIFDEAELVYENIMHLLSRTRHRKLEKGTGWASAVPENISDRLGEYLLCAHVIIEFVMSPNCILGPRLPLLPRVTHRRRVGEI